MKQTAKKRTTASEWAERIAAWESSGLTAEGFGKRIGVPGQRLSWWKWQLGKRQLTVAVGGLPKSGRSRRRAKPELLPVRVVGQGPGAPWSDRLVEVVLVGGRRLRVPVANRDELVRLVGILEGAASC
jgi:hypothetical protein